MLGSLIDPKTTKKSRKSRLSWAEWIDFVLSESFEAQRLKDARRERKAFRCPPDQARGPESRTHEPNAQSTLISLLRAESDATIAFKQRRAMEKGAHWAAQSAASSEDRSAQTTQGGFRWGWGARPKKAPAAWERGSPHAWWHDEPRSSRAGRARGLSAKATTSPGAGFEVARKESGELGAVDGLDIAPKAENLAADAADEFLEQENVMQKALAKSSAAIIRR